jgi:hypothetical protein
MHGPASRSIRQPRVAHIAERGRGGGLRPPFRVVRTDGSDEVLALAANLLIGRKIHANASRHSALSYEHATKIEAQLKTEVAELLARAEAADQAEVQKHQSDRLLDRQAAGPNPASPATPDERPGPMDAVVRPEIGAPSAVAQDEFRARLGPPCTEAVGALERSPRALALIVDEDLPGRRGPLRRKAIAVHQSL